jgi:hypothetical protein
MQIRRRYLIRDTISFEGATAAVAPVTRIAACAVIGNPLAGIATDDMDVLVPFGAELGDLLAKEAAAALNAPVRSYGKAAIIGTSGEIEHGAAIIHPRMGKPMRDVIGGGQAIIPSNVKVASVGGSIDVPLGHKDDVWSFDEIDTVTVAVPGAPRPDEIVVIVALADRGRPRPRVSKAGAVPPKME